MKNKTTNPRFEFRVFGDDLQALVAMFHTQFLNSEITKRATISDEIYLISQTNSDLNIKLRDNFLDIKKLISKSDSLEQWEPFFKIEFPIDVETLEEKTFLLFQIKLPHLNQNKYTKEQFLAAIQSYDFINTVKVHKKRTQYTIDELIFEISDIDIGGRTLQTLCLESTNKGKLLKFLKKFHMDTMKNTNYIEEIKLLKLHPTI